MYLLNFCAVFTPCPITSSLCCDLLVRRLSAGDESHAAVSIDRQMHLAPCCALGISQGDSLVFQFGVCEVYIEKSSASHFHSLIRQFRQ